MEGRGVADHIHIVAVQPGAFAAHRSHQGIKSYTHDFFSAEEMRELVRHPGLAVIRGERLGVEGAASPVRGPKPAHAAPAEPPAPAAPVRTVPKGKS